MEPELEKITGEDVPDLTRVMTRAFDDDAQKHLGVERGGPEGYDNGEFFRKWLFQYDESEGYKILLEGRIVGGFIVWIFEQGNNRLGTIFVDPDFQDKGIGTRAWEFILTPDICSLAMEMTSRTRLSIVGVHTAV